MSFNPFLAYSASAGSGKTFALSVRYVSLLFMGESPGTILAATFANKAAAEMKQRVVESLRDLHIEKNRPFADAVCEQTGFSYEKLISKQEIVLESFLADTSHIVTLDSFFSSILRSASLELGLEPDFVTKEEGEDNLEAHFLGEIEAAGLFSSLVRLSLNIEDKRFSKIFTLMQDFYKIDPLLPEVDKRSESTAPYEEACRSMQRDILGALEKAGAPARCIKQFTTATIGDLYAKDLFKNNTLGDHSWFKKTITDEVEEVYTALKKELNIWSNAREAATLSDLFDLYSYYKNANIANAKQSNVFTFDDLSYFTYRLLHESISKEFLYFKIDSKFKHILLDEFQDTSTLQFLLLKPLIDEIFAGKGQNEFRSFFYVGDTKQSLYRFRGGVEELFGKVADDYGMDISQMDTNYRSSKNVVEQVNRWFEAPVMEDYTPQKSKDDALEGYVEVIESDTVVDDAIKQAKRLLKAGIYEDDIVFLVSTNKDGQAVQTSCQAEGIQTILKTSSSLKFVPKIAAISAMLSYLYSREKIDAEAMLSKVGKKLSDFNLTWFSPFMSPLSIIHRLIKEFGYFNDDLNILKFLEFASSYDDIPTLLEEFRTSNIAIAANSIHGAKIMTIHSSKGLEFEHVILLDKLSAPNSDKSVLLYDYKEDLFIDKVFYRTKGRVNFDKSYASLMEKRELSSKKDQKNVLYVALTRAAEGLTVIRKTKASIFDKIGLGVMSIGSIEAPAEDREVRTPLDKDLEKKVSISSYGLQNSEKEEEDDEHKDHEAILFGTALHYALEMLDGFNEENIKNTLLSVSNKYGQVLSEAQFKDIEERMFMLIHDKEFQLLLDGATIRKEQALSYEGELKQIDLLLEYPDKNIIIDYKSSLKFKGKHQEQVEHYCKAMKGITGKESEGIVVYLLEDELKFSKVK